MVLEVDCDYLQIDTNVSFVISGKNRVECLCGRLVIDNTGDNLHDLLRLDNAKVSIPENGEAVIRRIEGKDSSLTLAQSEDNKYSIKRAYLVNSEAKNISGDIYLYAENSKINGIAFEDNSGIVLTTNAPHNKGISNFIVEKGERTHPDIPQTFNFCENQELKLIIDSDTDRASIKGNTATS